MSAVEAAFTPANKTTDKATDYATNFATFSYAFVPTECNALRRSDFSAIDSAYIASIYDTEFFANFTAKSTTFKATISATNKTP